MRTLLLVISLLLAGCGNNADYQDFDEYLVVSSKCFDEYLLYKSFVDAQDSIELSLEAIEPVTNYRDLPKEKIFRLHGREYGSTTVSKGIAEGIAVSCAPNKAFSTSISPLYDEEEIERILVHIAKRIKKIPGVTFEIHVEKSEIYITHSSDYVLLEEYP